MEKITIVVETTLNQSIDKVWDALTKPEHICKWNHASEDWHTLSAENDCRKGGTFSYEMAAKDGSFGFKFGGIYEEVIEKKKMAYTLGDGREVVTLLQECDDGVKVTESFEAEGTYPVEHQKSGWQAILDNFKIYSESM